MERLARRVAELPISDSELELLFYFRTLKLQSVQLIRAKAGYYELSLCQRRAFLNAASTFHLCKTIILENTAWSPEFSNEANYFKHVAVVIQYEDKLSTEKVMQFLKQFQNTQPNHRTISKKHFHFRLAEETDSEALTGYRKNAVTPFLMKTPLPVLLSKRVTLLNPAQLWLGGGEVDLKLGMSIQEFLRTTGALTAEIS